MFLQNGNGDRAAECLVKSAKIMGDVDAGIGIELFNEALDVYENDDREQFIGDT